MQLSQAILFVHDAALVAAFYERAFGLIVVDGDAASGFVRLRDPSGGATLAIHRTKVIGPPTGPRVDAATKLGFHVDDVAAARAGALAAGALPHGEIVAFDGVQFCDLLDPEGNIVQLTTR